MRGQKLGRLVGRLARGAARRGGEQSALPSGGLCGGCSRLQIIRGLGTMLSIAAMAKEARVQPTSQAASHGPWQGVAERMIVLCGAL
jgi:hypothetical protein